jgi:hypothetical protein
MLNTVFFYRDGEHFRAFRGPLMTVMAGLLVLYLVARQLKKSGTLRGD